MEFLDVALRRMQKSSHTAMAVVGNPQFSTASASSGTDGLEIEQHIGVALKYLFG